MVANHMGEQSRLQARLAALVEAELSRNATISEILIQIKQQMGGRLTRSDPHSGRGQCPNFRPGRRLRCHSGRHLARPLPSQLSVLALHRARTLS